MAVFSQRERDKFAVCLSQRERDKFVVCLPEGKGVISKRKLPPPCSSQREGAAILPVVAVLRILVHGDADFVAHHLVEIVYGVLHVAGDGAL